MTYYFQNFNLGFPLISLASILLRWKVYVEHVFRLQLNGWSLHGEPHVNATKKSMVPIEGCVVYIQGSH